MNRKLRRFLIIAPCALVLLPALLIIGEDWHGKRVWENCKRDLEAQGEHLDPESFIPPPIPDESNFAMNPLFTPLYDEKTERMSTVYEMDRTMNKMRLGSDLTEKGTWASGYQSLDLRKWQKYYRDSFPAMALHGSAGEDVLAVLGKYDADIMQLRAAVKERPQSQFPLKFDEAYNLKSDPYMAMDRLSQVLLLRIRAEQELNRTDDALADLEICFRMLEAMHDQPFIVRGILRIGTASMLMQPVWDGLASHRWTDAQLEKIQVLLRRQDFLADYLRIARAERGLSNANWNHIRADPKYAEVYFSFEDKNAGWLAGIFSQGCPGILYQDQAMQNFFAQEKILPLVDLKTRRVNFREANLLLDYLQDDRNFDPFTTLSRTTSRVTLLVLKNFVHAQEWIDLAYTGCAIERYRLTHGALPDTLDDLHIPDLPHDIIDGKPLRYHLDGADNYVLYSIGWDGKDDGGKPHGKNPANAYDWVWSLKPLDGTP